MKKTDNRGFSLVELLIAACILALVAIPLLHSFVASYRMNAKSKQYMRATTLAQNEMEIFEKETIESLSDPELFAYSEARPDGYQVSGPDENGCYVFKRLSVNNGRTDAQEFDVYITLDPERESADGRYHDINSVPVLNMNTVSTMDSGTYVQSVRTADGVADQDTVVYTHFYNNRNLSGAGKNWGREIFGQKLHRTITVTITKEPAGDKEVTRVLVSYDYYLDAAEGTGIMKAGYETWHEDTIIFDNAGTGEELKSVYLFYAPRYKANYSDDIVILNEQGLPADIYVIRQDLLKEGTNDQIQPVPIHYQATLTVHDKQTDGKSHGIYHTNMNIDGVEAEGRGKNVLLTFHDADDAFTSYMGAQAAAILGFRELGETVVKDRIYSMTVQVFKTGANPAADKPLTTMTGTKLE